MKILIAEDDAVSRMVLGLTLKKPGYEVTEAANGQEAWEASQREHFPLIISDWKMPDLDGLALTRMVRDRQTKYSYVILLTALGGKANYLEASDAGVDDFITKPFDEELLAARIRVAERILGLLSDVKTLRGLLPICSYCKKVRDDQNYWQELEGYMMECSEAKFSHGICPHCYEERVVPELELARQETERRRGAERSRG